MRDAGSPAAHSQVDAAKVFAIVDIVIVIPDNVDIVNSKDLRAAESIRIIGLFRDRSGRRFPGPYVRVRLKIDFSRWLNLLRMST